MDITGTDEGRGSALIIKMTVMMLCKCVSELLFFFFFNFHYFIPRDSDCKLFVRVVCVYVHVADVVCLCDFD